MEIPGASKEKKQERNSAKDQKEGSENNGGDNGERCSKN
jgi:hypothetical protein